MATHAGENSGLRYIEQVHQFAYAMFLTVPDDRERSESRRFGQGYQEVSGGWTLIMRMRLCAPPHGCIGHDQTDHRLSHGGR